MYIYDMYIYVHMYIISNVCMHVCIYKYVFLFLNTHTYLYTFEDDC